MGYEINSPVKTVYLPIFNNTMLIDEYKTKTGIDLHDLFDFDMEQGETHLKPNFNLVLYAGEGEGLLGSYGIGKGRILSYHAIYKDHNEYFYIVTSIEEQNPYPMCSIYVLVRINANHIPEIEIIEN